MTQSYYIFSNGEIKRHDNTLQLIKEDGTKTDIPIERVYDLYIFSEMTLNVKLLTFLSQKGVCLHFFNYYDFYSGSFYPREKHVSGGLLVKQVEHYQDNHKRVTLAKEFVAAGADNIYRNLRYYNERGKDLSAYMKEVEILINALQRAGTVQEVMGFEGNLRKHYYDAWKYIFNKDVEFDKRVKRPPDNVVNTLISFVNSLVYTKVLSEIYKTQINPTISYLHEPSDKRFSLSLDLAEIFKPLIADMLIFTLINKGIISEKGFDQELNYLRMKDETVKLIVKEFDNRMQTTIKHRDLNRDVSYKHLIRLEIYKLIKHLIGDKPYKGFRIWW